MIKPGVGDALSTRNFIGAGTAWEKPSYSYLKDTRFSIAPTVGDFGPLLFDDIKGTKDAADGPSTKFRSKYVFHPESTKKQVEFIYWPESLADNLSLYNIGVTAASAAGTYMFLNGSMSTGPLLVVVYLATGLGYVLFRK